MGILSGAKAFKTSVGTRLAGPRRRLRLLGPALHSLLKVRWGQTYAVH